MRPETLTLAAQQPFGMPAVNSIVARDQFAKLVAREEENWAKQEAGVIVVFCIVGLVAIGLGAGVGFAVMLATRGSPRAGSGR